MSDEQDILSLISHAGAGGTAAILVYLYFRFGRRESDSGSEQEQRDRLRDVQNALEELADAEREFRHSVQAHIATQVQRTIEQTKVLERIDDRLCQLLWRFGPDPRQGPR